MGDGQSKESVDSAPYVQSNKSTFGSVQSMGNQAQNLHSNGTEIIMANGILDKKARTVRNVILITKLVQKVLEKMVATKVEDQIGLVVEAKTMVVEEEKEGEGSQVTPLKMSSPTPRHKLPNREASARGGGRVQGRMKPPRKNQGAHREGGKL